MRVLHVTPSIAAGSGGTTAALFTIVEALRQAGCIVEIASSDDDGPAKTLAAAAPERTDPLYHFFPKASEFYKFGRGFGAWMKAHARDYDLVHVHALFSHMPVAAARIAIGQGVPCIVTPHGMLNRYGIANKPLMKRVSLALFERGVIAGATAIHMTSLAEVRDFDALGIKARLETIPLAVDLPEQGDAEACLSLHPDLRGSRCLTFVGRLNPVKNLEGLIDGFALAASDQPALRLILIGSGEPAYEAELRQRAAERGIAERICWTGHLTGPDKANALAASHAYVQPSHSESFGLSVIEALSLGLPCVVSEGVALADELANEGLIQLTGTDAASIAAGIGRALNGGDNGGADQRKAFARENFSRDQFASRMMALYQDVIKTGNK